MELGLKLESVLQNPRSKLGIAWNQCSVGLGLRVQGFWGAEEEGYLSAVRGDPEVAKPFPKRLCSTLD